jgi:hypothetical protein
LRGLTHFYESCRRLGGERVGLICFLPEPALERQPMTTTNAAEKRTSHRRSTYNGAEIISGGGKPKIGCIVRDLSTKGAKLEFRFNAPAVPDRFQLNIPDVLKQTCRVMWREGREIGVSFI